MIDVSKGGKSFRRRTCDRADHSMTHLYRSIVLENTDTNLTDFIYKMGWSFLLLKCHKILVEFIKLLQNLSDPWINLLFQQKQIAFSSKSIFDLKWINYVITQLSSPDVQFLWKRSMRFINIMEIFTESITDIMA